MIETFIMKGLSNCLMLLRFLCFVQFAFRSQGSLVNESIRLLWISQPRNNRSIRYRVRDFSLLPYIQTDFRGRSASYSMDTWGLSPREDRPDLEAVHSPPYIGESETQWSFTSILPYALWRVQTLPYPCLSMCKVWRSPRFTTFLKCFGC